MNDPNNCRWRDFVAVGAKKLTFRDYTVLIPLGEPFTIEAVVPHNADSKNIQKPITPDQVMGLADEVTIHLGVSNAKPIRKYQLFRRWDGQLGVCIATFDDERKIRLDSYSIPMYESLSSGKGKGGQANPNGGSSKSSSSSTAGSSAPTPTVPLIGVLDPTLCRQREIILGEPKAPLLTEAESAARSAKAYEVSLRSVQQVFEYLGLLMRNTKPDDKDALIKIRLLSQGEQAKTTLQVAYGEGTYVVDDESSKEILAILHQLVNSNKLSSDIPTTKSVLIVP
jgi:hypothetical protein